MTARISEAVLGKLRSKRGSMPPPAARSKYGNKKVAAFGLAGEPIVFDSKREAKRWGALVGRLKAGEICGLERQPVFHFYVGENALTYQSNRKVRYIADFRYFDVIRQELVVEDVKSEPTKTPEYKIKWALMRLFHGINVKEVS